jgi:HMG (high mobility group) box
VLVVSDRLLYVIMINIVLLVGLMAQTTDIAKLVSESWKSLPPEERELWEGKAEQDRAR